MANAVIMPKSGISVESCIIGEWKVKVGDAVKVGDILFTYETDKSSFECESTAEGQLLEIYFNEGDEVPCLMNVCAVGQTGEDCSALRPDGAAAPAAAPAPAAEPVAAPAAAPVAPVAAAPTGPVAEAVLMPKAGITVESCIIGSWQKKVGDAIKEFSIRSIDGSKTTTEAFEALGLDADEMMATFAAGGDEATYAFQGVLTALMDMDDEVARDALGVSLFGTQWEDLGTDAMAALADINAEAYNTEDALGKINSVKYNNIGDAFEGIKRQAEVSLLPLASTIANAFTQIAPVLGSLFEKLGPIIEQVTADAMPFITEFLDGMIGTLEEVMPMVLDLAKAILPVISSFVKQLLPPLLNLIKQLLPPIMQLVQALLPPLSQILLAILPMLTQILSAILPVLISLLNALLPIIQPILDVALMLLNNVVMPILEPLMALISAILPVISPLLTVILSALKPVFDLLQLLAPVISAIIGVIAKVVGWIADGLGWLVKLVFGDPEGATESVSAYATGGITNGVSIAGEDPRYPHEYIISPNPAYRQQNLSYWAQAGRMLGADESDFNLSSSGDSGGTSVSLGGVTFAPNINITGQADKGTIMEAIEAEYPEFIDMLDEYLMSRGVTVYAQ